MVLMYVSHDSRGPAVIEAAFSILSSQRFVSSLSSKVVVHVNLWVLIVRPSSPLVEVVLPEFPGSNSVGP